MAVETLSARQADAVGQGFLHILWEANRRGLDLTVDFQTNRYTDLNVQMTVYLNKRWGKGSQVLEFSAELTGVSPVPLGKVLALIETFPVLEDVPPKATASCVEAS